MNIPQDIRKQIRSLSTVKGRRESGLFMAEGTKCVTDTIHAFDTRMIVATAEWITSHSGIIPSDTEVLVVPHREIERISNLKCPPEVIAVYSIPDYRFEPEDVSDKLVLALDCIQDPGNLGTIIRVADWMGVRTILASEDTVDVYNPKVIQATMGSISRVHVHYLPLVNALSEIRETGAPIYGTLLDEHAESLYNAALSPSGIIVMGNEGRGISEPVRNTLTQSLYIPPFPPDAHTAESLNVAVATSITLAEFRRKFCSNG